MKIGFIGTGSMGTVLIESFIRSGALQPSSIIASNRSQDKAERLAAKYPGLTVARSNLQVASTCGTVFVCVRPLVFKAVIDEIKPFVTPDTTVISITSPVLLKHLESALPCKVAKVIPSITNGVLSGAVLCIYGERIDEQDRLSLEWMLGMIGKPVRVSERFTRVTSDISSCGPAFLAYFVQKLVDAAVQVTGVSREEATRLASEMVLGTGKLLNEGGFSPETLRQRVAVPGGIIEAGLELMERELDTTFIRLLQATHAKYDEDVEKVEHQFYGPIVE
ncbi:late competence protein ComER [Paenibacillus hemerocallicola]|uniref:Pyrroline-5-carboxylate reductase n=1 Tax=Paenibacillus hemerocallicola TaxID=1172614 RepID=A0A5C4TGL5_9BACL|nr:late competence protein ComER [Paenibacillus hemerocallicola]TNJ67932.1 late competence protein ComER [Paenibacillus hemerocallicola]